MMAVSFIISSSSPSLVVTSKGTSTDDGWIKHTTLHHLRESRIHMFFVRLKTYIIKPVETIDILLVEQGLPKRSNVLDQQLASLLKERSAWPPLNHRVISVANGQAIPSSTNLAASLQPSVAEVAWE